MDTASVLALDVAPSPDHPRTADLVERARASATPGGLLEALLDHPTLARDAAALARVVVADPDEGEPMTADVADIIMPVATLALALDRHTASLFADADDDAGRVEAAAGEFAAVGAAFAAMATDVRDRLAKLPGWPAGCAAFGTALVGIVDVLTQDRQLGGLGSTVAYRDAADVAAADLVASAAAILLDDRTLMTHPNECELALRLGNGVVARAREVVAYMSEDGPLRPDDMIARRFAVPAGVIRLGTAEIERCMRAIFAAELLDLGDLLAELDDGPFRTVLARTVHAMVRLADSNEDLVIATVRPDHDAIMNELRVVARLDGRITADERALLRGMDEHLHAFDELVARIREDRVVDFDEFRQLRTTRQHILDDVLRIALADDVVSDDERGLLVRVLELLPMLRPAP
jgi:hypothetical protein